MKKTNLLVLALSALLVTSCGGNTKSEEAKSETKSQEASQQLSEQGSEQGSQQEQDVLPTFDLAANVVEAPEGASEYGVKSAELYNAVLGKYYSYAHAADSAASLSERYALQAIAEAKLLEAGIIIPGSSNGGNYAINKVAPYTISRVTWGSDGYRYHNAVIATEALKVEDRDALKALYKEKKGTGTYEAAAKAYLTEHGYTLKDTYNIAYNGEPETYDILNSYYATDSEPLVNTFDGLLEYDGEQVQRPALAESYTVSEDGKTYTFKIRSGVKWVDKDQNDVADVTPDDFVAGFQHMLDCRGGLEDLVRGLVKNAGEYLDGEVTDFAQVGVKAEGDSVVYTLETACPYFLSMLGYSIFAPMSRTYYTSQGGKFGAEFDADADGYHYAEDYGHIAYCGPYIITQYTKENTFVFSQNNKYWNKENINIKTITWLNNDGSDSTKAYRDYKAGTIDGATINTAVKQTAVENGDFAKYAFVSTPDASTFPLWLNLSRQSFANPSDATQAVSLKTEAERAKYAKAVLNPYFRMAVCLSLNRRNYYAVSKGDDIALNAALNSWTPGEFISLPEALTIKINGVDKSYPAGTMYGQVMQDQLNADGFENYIKVFDPTLEGGLGSGHGFDGWYNPEGAAKLLAKAVEQLAEENVTISAQDPVVLEFLTYENDIAKSMAQVVKQSIEASTGGLVQVKVCVAETRKAQLQSGYYPNSGELMNYDMVAISGWGPDYGDPKTFLDCFLPMAGGMAKCLGMY